MTKSVQISKITITCLERFYEKYDVIEINNTEYICISRPKKLESEEWSIDIIPIGILTVEPLISIWKYNKMPEMCNEIS